jgi:hypothetical protein
VGYEHGCAGDAWLDRELPDTHVVLVSDHLDACLRCGLEASSHRWLKVRLAGLAPAWTTASSTGSRPSRTHSLTTRPDHDHWCRRGVRSIVSLRPG